MNKFSVICDLKLVGKQTCEMHSKWLIETETVHVKVHTAFLCVSDAVAVAESK